MISRTGKSLVRSLALLDVLLAVSFLLIGLVPIIRIYANSLAAATYAENSRMALDYLDTRLNQAEAEARSRGGLAAGQSEEEINLGGRKFTLRIFIQPADLPGLNDITCRLDAETGKTWSLSSSVAARQ